MRENSRIHFLRTTLAKNISRGTIFTTIRKENYGFFRNKINEARYISLITWKSALKNICCYIFCFNCMYIFWAHNIAMLSCCRVPFCKRKERSIAKNRVSFGERKGKANQERGVRFSSPRRRKTRYAFSAASGLSYPLDILWREDTRSSTRKTQEKYKTWGVVSLQSWPRTARPREMTTRERRATSSLGRRSKKLRAMNKNLLKYR